MFPICQGTCGRPWDDGPLCPSCLEYIIEESRIRIRRGSHDASPPQDLRTVLRCLYPRPVSDSPVEAWPQPPSFSEPPEKPRVQSTLGERVKAGEAVRLALQLADAPL